MNRIQQYLCTVAWRILWRWWPDRVYMAAVSTVSFDRPMAASTSTMEAGTPSHPHMETINKSFLVWEKLDHPGKMVKSRD